jgi:hypothetical protein
MKDLMQEVTHTRWAKVELVCTGENRFDVIFHTRRIPMLHTTNQFEAGDFHIQKWNLSSREVYSYISKYFYHLANGGYDKLMNKVMNAIVDLRQIYFLTAKSRMDQIHQQANEDNAAFDLDRIDTMDHAHEEALEDNTVWDIEHSCTCDTGVESSFFQEYGCCEYCFHSQTSQEAAHGTLYLVDMQDPSDPEESDLEAAKEFLMNIWMESEGVEDVLEKVNNCTTVQELNRMLDGIDYELMNEKQLRSIQWEWLCAEAPVKDMSAAERIRERQKFLNSAFVRVETPCSCDDEEDRYTQLHGICEYCNLVVEPVYKAKGKISLRGPKRIAQKLKEKYRSITATYYAEKYGIVDYEVRDIFMSYKETFSSEEYLAVVNLDNLKEHRVLI